MAHAEGTYLGGVRSIADVRERCAMDPDGGCWHLRTGHGKPLRRDRAHKIWIHGRGCVSAPRAVWELAHERPMPKGRRAVRMCESYDCANPEHIRALRHSDAQRHIIGGWHDMTPGRRAQLVRMQRARRRFTPEQVAEIRLSTVSAAALARKLGCAPEQVRDVRNGKTYRDPVASVWGLAA